MNQEIPDVQAGFREGRGTRSQVANICWITEKAKEFEKNIYFCFTDCAIKPLTVWITANWKILKEMGIPDHLTCRLRNVYARQETTVITRHGMMDCFNLGKEVHQGCILPPCLFNLCEEYSCEMLGLMNSKLESRFLGEISTTSNM